MYDINLSVLPLPPEYIWEGLFCGIWLIHSTNSIYQTPGTKLGSRIKGGHENHEYQTMINAQVSAYIMKRDSWLMYAVSQPFSHVYGWTVVFLSVPSDCSPASVVSFSVSSPSAFFLSGNHVAAAYLRRDKIRKACALQLLSQSVHVDCQSILLQLAVHLPELFDDLVPADHLYLFLHQFLEDT